MNYSPAQQQAFDNYLEATLIRDPPAISPTGYAYYNNCSYCNQKYHTCAKCWVLAEDLTTDDILTVMNEKMLLTVAEMIRIKAYTTTIPSRERKLRKVLERLEEAGRVLWIAKNQSESSGADGTWTDHVAINQIIDRYNKFHRYLKSKGSADMLEWIRTFRDYTVN